MDALSVNTAIPFKKLTLENKAAIMDMMKDVARLAGDRAINFYEKNQGKAVRVKHTSYTGKLVGVCKNNNENSLGLDAALRVEITDCENQKFMLYIGSIFEYPEEMLEVI